MSAHTTIEYVITPDQGLNLTSRHMDKNKTGITFITLDSQADRREFRRGLEEALSKVTK